MALFLTCGLLLANFLVLREVSGDRGILGGPAREASEQEILGEGPLSVALGSAPEVNVDYEELAAAVETKNATETELPFPASLQDEGRPLGSPVSQVGIVSYTVKKGDTLSRIALDFGISVQTITAANPSLRANALQIGQELNILPVSGVIYEVKEGETLESVASLFGVRPSRIQEFNKTADFGNLQAGISLVIPGAKPNQNYSVQIASLPDFSGYFLRPAQGFNWGRLHNYNAVDIANACGTPVAASAEGLVVDGSESGWNSGYGGFVLVEHPNGAKTRYAHLGKVTAGIGDYVRQGEEVGQMGNTGNVHGPTGCHLHFEVIGAKNPFAS